MKTYLLIGLGGFLGGVARYWLGGLISFSIGETFPWATLIINSIGSFIIGFFAYAFSPVGPLLIAPEIRQFLMIGLCGGFTTFSAFSLETLTLAQNGEWLKVFLNMIFSLMFCLFAAWLGHISVILIFQQKEEVALSP